MIKIDLIGEFTSTNIRKDIFYIFLQGKTEF